MANGTSRLALSRIQMGNKVATAELNEEMKLDKSDPSTKIPLKYPTKNNHSK